MEFNLKIVLYSEDIQLLSFWQDNIQEDFSIVEDIESLYDLQDTIIVLNICACNNECKDFLDKVSKTNKVLILDRTPSLQKAKSFIKDGASGYGNVLIHSAFFSAAFEAISEGMIWLHPEFTSMLILENNITLPDKDNDTILSVLSEREKEVALLLIEGDIYKIVAQKLDITPRTVRAHASNVYKKLNVKDRLGLALLFK